MKFICGIIVLAALIVLARSCLDSGSPSNGSSASQSTSVDGKNWYEGGTLHRGTMGEWKMGSPGDKLATAGDWVAHMRDKLKPDVKPNSMSALRPLAVELMACVEDSYDDKLANQKAADVAFLCMTTLGWLNGGAL
jgi:hypothetical protein